MLSTKSKLLKHFNKSSKVGINPLFSLGNITFKSITKFWIAWNATSSMYTASSVLLDAKYKFLKTKDIVSAQRDGPSMINGFNPIDVGSHGSIRCTGISRFLATLANLFVCSKSGVTDINPKFL